ncbi:MAG: tetratricopeptide repeat protein [Desulfosudaceae bacterium]
MPLTKTNISAVGKMAGIVLLLSAIALLLYGHILPAPFVFDDSMIFQEPRLLWTDLSAEELTGLAQVKIDNVTHRYVANLTFALNHYLGRRHSAGYHLVNLAIHILAAFLVYLIARDTLSRRRKRWAAASLAAALLWLVHPLHIQSVTYIWQRMNSLAALFYLLALFFYIKARNHQRAKPGSHGPAILLFAGCGLAGLLALGAKQSAATLPLLLFLYEWLIRQQAAPGWLKKRICWLLLAAAAAAGAALFFLEGSPLAAILSSYEGKSFSPGQRLLTQPGVILYYLSLLVWPHPSRLNLDYDFPLSTTPLAPDLLLPLLALTTLASAVVFLARSHRLAAFAICWFLVTLVPESSLVGLELMCSYRTYLPSVFLFIALAEYLPAAGRPHRAALLGLVILIIVGGFWTWQRNHNWRSDLALWQDTVRKSPHLAWPRHNLALAYSNRGHLNKAIHQYQKSLAIKQETLGPNHPETAKTYSNLGVAYDQGGYLEKAAAAYHRALAIYQRQFGRHDLRTAAVFNNLGVLCGRAGDYDKSIFFFRKALPGRLAELGPVHHETAEIYNNLGMAYAGQGEHSQALSFFEKALPILETHLGPDHPRTLRTRASLERLRRDHNQAP